ncbi:MAG: hypothetical protein UY33_C0032G0030 [Candidatus Amesbacteria bacterium GW2011_GWA1_48_9]|uniref:Uncharacterized protein n=1 Tax=Candidatus Amesbacteria bacterium GW2011_GWA1_48_9 TaxID=1618355 RepID=A0A0G1UZD3_9BACT|nr:MAG: hypothetical protein UY33_C0032G0030 [Candidatus Amesbacteria bacterium GW2011_GWA1_48_9]OGC99164.1 MAG: hypothetical protein A2W16_03650 [Candidatus Amesbacteria bacterium RBG_16_48_31]OGD01995.1 MAG: hypothetical protein A2354_04130 [Candidatus Amesbacteria bacterium RIFOXYB1_FULL_47_12]
MAEPTRTKAATIDKAFKAILVFIFVHLLSTFKAGVKKEKTPLPEAVRGDLGDDETGRKFHRFSALTITAGGSCSRRTITINLGQK